MMRRVLLSLLFVIVALGVDAATLVSAATGNFTAAGTWWVGDTTSYLDSEAGSSTVTTAYSGGRSSAFTPGAITINGVTVKLSARLGATGTCSCSLYNDTLAADVAATEVTINVTDFDNVTATNGGWYRFQFADVLLIVANAYRVQCKTSTASMVSLYRDSTASNWARILTTSTTGAPASGDQLHVIGEHTGAGTGNSFTVTMNNTATTSFGPTVSGGPPQGMTIGKRGTLTWQDTAATAYYLKMKGVIAVFSGGTFTMGASGAPIDSAGTTAVLEFDSAANIDSGFSPRDGSSSTLYGASLATWATTLTADASAAATVLTVGSTSGWAVGGEIALASTTRTSSQAEKRTILTVDSATQVTLTAGLTNAHSGTAPTRAEVIYLTRNVKVRGISASLQGYILESATSVLAAQYVEYLQLGSGSASRRGIDVATTTGSASYDKCSLHDYGVLGSIGVQFGSSPTNNITLQDNVFYNIAGTFVATTATTGTNYLIDGNICILTTTSAGNNGMVLSDVGGVVTDNVVASCGGAAGFIVSEANLVGTFARNTAHSGNGLGFSFTSIYNSSLSDLIAWRNSSSGLIFTTCKAVTLTTLSAFGNTTSNVDIASISNLAVSAATLNGDTTFATLSGFRVTGQANAVLFTDSTLGVASGILTTHSTGDITVSTGAYLDMVARNCTLASATELSNQAGLADGSNLGFERHDQTAGLHKSLNAYGTRQIDTSVFRTASPSEKLTPISASVRFQSGRKRFYIASGSTITPTIYAYKTVAGANQPRLMVAANQAIGWAADVICDTMSVGVTTWEALTCTTATSSDDGVGAFYVDTDSGNTLVYLSDWSF